MKSTQQAIRVRSTAELESSQDSAVQTPMLPQLQTEANPELTQQNCSYALDPWAFIAADSMWFAAIAHSSPDLIGAVSLSGDWICLNPAGRSHLNWTSELPPLAATLSQAAQQQWQEVGLPTIMQHGYWRAQIEMCDASGQLIRVESQWFLVRDRTTDQPICMATISQRLTDSTLDAATQASPQSRLADAAHELKSPLTVIASSTEILQTRYDRLDVARREKHFQRIHTKIKQITQILDDLMVLSWSEQSNLDLQPSAIDVLDLCTSIIEEAQTSTSKHEIIFSPRLTNSSTQRSIWINSTLLERVMLNLLSNSIKYSPSGGKIHFDLSIHANCLKFQVRDQGIGIPIADQQQLFESFYRASNVGRIAGTGLGLAIAKRCIEHLDGQITVHSQVGVGTVFDVDIPIELSRIT